MWMVIGGAETHVVELSRELAARGHDVTVASFGGVYVKQLEAAGIKHVTVPLHKKSPAALIKSYVRLKALIEKENFDIVHAHSRIPAFVCGLLARRMGFRFVTTAHWVFKVTPLLARFSDCGDHTFAVSCDIKQYLKNNYGVPSDNVTLTINGIDTDRFSPTTDGARVIDELSLDRNAFRVVCVSRIDHKTALPCLELCDASGTLGRDIPNLEVVIVGGGTAFDELKKRAERVNSALGRECVRLTGPRTDIPELVACADVFVGVSRSALEAMSAEKPVVFAGPEGYAGIFRDEIKPLARLTNFTFRTESLPKAARIVEDIRRLYGMTPDERLYYGRLGREEIINRYSMAKMADDHVEVYRKLTPYRRYDRGEIIISGYYGYENIGDDSLLTPIIEGIRARMPDAKVTVLAKNPKLLARICRVRTIHRFNIFRIRREMKHARLLISGGGSLLQDGTSKKSLFYYTYIMRMAKRFGLKVMLYANGLGPLIAESSRQVASDVITDADYVSLRENASLILARELDVKGELHVTADPAFLLEVSPELWIDYMTVREGLGERYFIVSIKDGNNFDGARTGRDTVTTMARDIRKLAEKYSLMPVFVPMYPDRDTVITKKLAHEVGCGKVIEGLTACELCGLMKRAELVIGTRLHMLIFAASMAVPMLGITYDPKIDAFLDYIGESERMLDISSLSDGELEAAADKLLSDAAAIRERLVLTAEELRKKASLDCDAVVRILSEK